MALSRSGGGPAAPRVVFIGCCLGVVTTANTDIFSPGAKVWARTTAFVSVDTNMS